MLEIGVTNFRFVHLYLQRYDIQSIK